MFQLKDRKVGLNSLAFSRDGTRLYASGYRGVVQVWDLGTKQVASRLLGCQENVADISVTPDGQRVIAVSLYDVWTWELDDPSFCGRPWKHRTFAHGLALSPDATRCAVLTGGPVSLYSFPDFKRLWWRGTGECSTTFSSDGRLLIHGSTFGLIQIRNATTGEKTHEYGPPNGCGVKALSLSPNSRFLAWCADTHLYLAQVDPFDVLLHHKLGRTHFLSVAYHPSGRFFATVNGDGKVDYWDGTTGTHRQAFDWGVGKLHDITFDANGDRAACCSKTGEIVVWDVDE